MAARKKTTTAIVPAGEAPPVLALALPLSADELAGLLAEAQDKAEACVGLECPTADAYETCQGLLAEVVSDRDAVVAMRTESTQAADRAVRAIRATLKPILDALEVAEGYVRGAMGGYLKAKAEAEREVQAAALEAATTGDADGLVEALTASTELAASPEQAARWRWVVKRIAKDLLPPEYLIPDEAAIKAVARAAGSGEEPPVIPGVVFEREPVVAVSR